MQLHNYTLIAFSFSILLSGFNVRGDDLEGKIKDFILKNPEVIIESLQKFEVKKENEQKHVFKQKISCWTKNLLNKKVTFCCCSVWHHVEYALHGVLLHEVGSRAIFEIFTNICWTCI